MRPLLLPSVGLLALIAAACGPKPPPAPTPAAATVPSASEPITDRDWDLVALGDRSAPTGAGDRPPTLRLESGSSRAVGFAGCNRYSGSYTLGGDSLKFGPAVSTKMSCGDSDQVERGYLAMLPLVVTYAATDSSLTLNGPGGPLARFRRP